MDDFEVDDAHVLFAWPAFVDLLAATVLILLVLIAVVIVVIRDPGIEIWRDNLVAQLEELRAQDTTAFDIDEVSDELAVGIAFPAQATFPRSRFQFDSLRSEARAALDRLSDILRSEQILQYTAEVRVVGYTDTEAFSDPLSAFSNWELSAARASAVARYLVTFGQVDPCRVSATGRGSHFPVTDAQGRRDPEMSRRIEIWIMPATRSTSSNLDGTCDPVGDHTALGVGT